MEVFLLCLVIAVAIEQSFTRTTRSVKGAWQREMAAAGPTPGLHGRLRAAGALTHAVLHAPAEAKAGWQAGWAEGRARYTARTGRPSTTPASGKPAGAANPKEDAPHLKTQRERAGAGPKKATGSRPGQQEPAAEDDPFDPPFAPFADRDLDDDEPASFVHDDDHTYCLKPGCPQCRPAGGWGWQAPPGTSGATSGTEPGPAPTLRVDAERVSEPARAPLPALTAGPAAAGTAGDVIDAEVIDEEVDDPQEPMATVIQLHPRSTTATEGESAMTTATGETTTIDATRTYLGELGGHVQSQILSQLELCHSTLTRAEMDPATLGHLVAAQESFSVAATEVQAALSSLNARHAAMEEAVNTTPHAAQRDYYKHA